ncbi:hypothetical protein E1B28_001115 [Marasmius oreades]|uniref:Uncharacterized protein n=1 Tax=Marasmius oreades TaxID=181124 RepID=A0A9P8AF23_9AGAR|nr:uncharacterized protein E1B28_001115 [Marasmius oreades]KAG7099252.1 hypothetical protein E1B28_001115 [Marasmius oreades]
MHRTVVLSFLLVSLFAVFAQAQVNNTTSNGNNSNSQTSGTSQTTSGGNQTNPTVNVITTTGSDGHTQTITVTPTGSNGNSTQSTSSKPLPTAATDALDGGGGATGAPVPGGGNGAYGPDDNYIAAAQSLPRNLMLVTFAGVAVGALVTIF